MPSEPKAAAAPPALATNTRWLAYLAFFLSGASSLIFQALWTRMLHHVFGSSSIAMATVLTAFMAGLGLGAYVFGKVADRIPHPILTYGVAEIFVGVWALILPALVSPEGWLASVNAFLRNTMGAESTGFMLARFACVAPLLLVPTTLMGASLPLLSRHFVRRGATARDVSAVVGSLYSVNTFGAVLGVGLGGFVLMPFVGLSMTTYVAVGMNVLLGALIFGFRRFLLGDTWKPGEPLRPWPVSDEAASGVEATRRSDDSDHHAGVEDVAFPLPRGARGAALVAFALSGTAAFAYEIVWTRALAMTIGSSVYSFTIILLTFLIGIAGGSAIASAAIAPRASRFVVVAASSLVLLAFGNAVAGFRDGMSIYIALTGAFALPIVFLFVGYVLKAVRRGEDVGLPRLPVAFMLAAPLVSSLVLTGLASERMATLALIVATVTATLVAFVAIVVTLRRYPMLQLGVLQLFIAGASIANYAFQDEIPCAFASMVAALQDPTGQGRSTVSLSDHVPLVQFFMFLTAGLCTLPATMGMGAMFPLALRVWTSGGRSVGQDVGMVYSANTLGSILGAWLTGFVLMPWLGIELTLVRVGIYLNLGLALMLLIVAAGDPPARETEGSDAGPRRPPAPPGWHTAMIYVLAPLIPALVAFLFLATQRPTSFMRWDLSRMTLGVFRVSMAENACNVPQDVEIVFYRDGLSTTVTVEKFRFGHHVALKNNGKVDASNGDDMPTQIMVTGYPLLMHPRGPEGLDVAVIGFGSGVSVGTALRFPVRSVDVVELERAIPEASHWFEDVNGLDYQLEGFPYVRMDRLSVINDDGRNYLAATDRSYDVIVSEPSNPWITGVSDLFTTDHFRITKRRLREGGIYCQWVQLYELSPENIKTIYRTFASQFRHVVVFSADDLSSDTILLGSDSPLPLDLDRVRVGYAFDGVPEELERAHIHTAQDVFARTLFADRDEVMSYTRIERRRGRDGKWQAFPDSSNDPERSCSDGCERVPVGLNTDDNMKIEFAAPRDLIGFQRYEGYLANLYSPEWPYGRLPGRVLGLGEGEEGADARAELALALAAHGRRVEAAHYLRESQELGASQKTLVALETLTRLVADDAAPEVPIELPTPGPQLSERERRALLEGFEAVRREVDEGDFEAALRSMEEIPSPLRREGGPSMSMLHGYLLVKTGDQHPSRRFRDAAAILEELRAEQPAYAAQHPELHYLLGRAYDLDLRFDLGVQHMRLFVELQLGPTADFDPTAPLPPVPDPEGSPSEPIDPPEEEEALDAGVPEPPPHEEEP